MKCYKFSKAYVAVFMYRFAFLLFVPFLQGMLFARTGGLKLFTLYSADLAVAVLLLAVAVIRLKSSQLRLNDRCITVSTGAILRVRERAFVKGEGCFAVTEGLLLRLLKGCRIRLFFGTAHASAYIKFEDSKEILSRITHDGENQVFASGIFRSLLMSASFSNALTGLLAAVPVLRRMSAVLGARQTALLVEEANLQGLISFTGLPPVLSRISAILFLCWIIGFSTEFFREYGLKLKAYGSHFFISKGLMTKSRVVFSASSVRAVIFRQSLLMILLGLYSSEACLNIRPRRKIHILSAAKKSRCESLEKIIFGEKGEVLAEASASYLALWGYTYLPFLCTAAFGVGIIFLKDLYILRASLSVLLGIVAIWFVFRAYALGSCRLRIWKHHGEICYFSGMNLTRCVFKRKEVTAVDITQSIFQKISGRCNIVITLVNTRSVKVRLKHIDIKEAEGLLELF